VVGYWLVDKGAAGSMGHGDMLVLSRHYSLTIFLILRTSPLAKGGTHGKGVHVLVILAVCCVYGCL